MVYAFQTKLTYGMICYNNTTTIFRSFKLFQTKLTYGMICYRTDAASLTSLLEVSN